MIHTLEPVVPKQVERPRSWRRWGAGAGVVLLVAACGGGASPSPAAPSAATSPSTPPAASPSTAETGTLKLWHYEGPTSAMGVAWAAAIQEFEATHPGVTVAFEEKGFEQIRQTAPQVLNSDAAPDILEYNKGNATAGLLSTQGLLTDLTDVVTQRGWDKLLSPSLQTTARYDEKGVMGSGKWYGIPNYAEYVMVYYNKDMFEEHNLSVPTTLEEFEAVLDAFVGAGVTPISNAAAEYPAQQIWYELTLSKADRNLINAFQLYQGDIDFHNPAFTFGAQTLVDWVSKGYIDKDSTGIKAEDMGVAFEQGNFPIMISGSWWYGRFVSEIKDFEWASFPFPGNQFHPGSSGNIWVIPAKSQHPDWAADFIDITMKPDIQLALGNAGGIPVAADPSGITDPKNKELIDNFTSISDADGLAFYPDWPAPGYYDALVSAVQDLIGGTTTPDQFLDAIAGPYNDYRSTLGG